MSEQENQSEALRYHEFPQPGKIAIQSIKPTNSQADLSLAYSPGVAEPCKEIAEHPGDVYRYTNKPNTVAVISDGSAVLGLGNIGPEASKPVMEGKGVLFKVYGGVDAYDLELSCGTVESFVNTVKNLEPTFGGINLEDIRAPACFEIEDRLGAEMDIPVMHDDQHGTAIITGAALLNALTFAGKELADIKVVVNGAGASAIASGRFFKSLGVRADNILMADSKGVIRSDRENLTELKAEFATDQHVNSLSEALEGADVFLGLSVGNALSPDMLKGMATNPVVFALANPIPEIDYHEAKNTRSDVIIATGRSDFPNQVNNVLGFPFIFRGALDVQATQINEPMKVAASEAIAYLAREPVPADVLKAYGLDELTFNPDYLIPKPMDPRLITRVSAAVADAAIRSRAHRIRITDWEAYEASLQKLVEG